MIPDDILDTTELNCSRCNTTITTYPGHPDPTTTITWALALDLIRQAIHHGYTCKGQPR